mmetsp:Transcript_22580/g.34427  ORF Transcript_22580/g.34427 Transcript_22580/m.34427 type:complete len:204 (+) Transcript_22580:101-712(+)|eukprot:CAMPEP_0196135606 /NCGR_PEP_ID=MMETSP0910-20130528/4188_1 /TAXON_ID=49265 /ORGANISM="Thalassiosira rotula, Strain GSO102" /LENGTH=203 /DNA_ID=CAMNT_0041395775 /DNA_START=85 /DNA_END=696 /DNA_ORIENTATION=+
MSKKRAPGEFTPSQFATCIEKGLNIYAHDTLTSPSSTAVAKSSSKTSNKTKRNYNNPTTSTNSSLPRVECTNGAMEALRLCHATFLSTLASSLGEDSSAKPLSEEDVVTCLEEMGLSDLAKRGVESLLGDSKGGDDDDDDDDDYDNTRQRQQKRQPPSQNKRRRKKKKAFAGFEGTEEELIAEQERLLAESARRVQMMKSAGG